jgi:hypothetical protein
MRGINSEIKNTFTKKLGAIRNFSVSSIGADGDASLLGNFSG